MGWLRHILLGDMGQSLDIEDHAAMLARQSRTQRQQNSRLRAKDIEISRLKARTERLHLAVTALSRFLIVKDIIQESELENFIAELDTSDGKADGKLDFEDSNLRPKLNFPGRNETSETP